MSEHSESDFDPKEVSTGSFIPPPPPPEDPPVDSSNYVRFPSKRLTSRGGQSLPCVVCKINASKYKFKCCLFGYCSVACFKNHTDCAPRPSTPAPPRRRFIDPFADLDMPPEDVVTQDQLQKLSTDASVRAFLQHPKLRKIIIRIDSTRDRHAALERHMQTDPAFAQVVHAIARAIDAPLTQQL